MKINYVKISIGFKGKKESLDYKKGVGKNLTFALQDLRSKKCAYVTPEHFNLIIKELKLALGGLKKNS